MGLRIVRLGWTMMSRYQLSLNNHRKVVKVEVWSWFKQLFEVADGQGYGVLPDPGGYNGPLGLHVLLVFDCHAGDEGHEGLAPGLTHRTFMDQANPPSPLVSNWASLSHFSFSSSAFTHSLLVSAPAAFSQIFVSSETTQINAKYWSDSCA